MQYAVNIPKISLKDKEYSLGDVVEIDDEYYSQFKEAFDKHIEFNHIIPIQSIELKQVQDEIMTHVQSPELSDEQIEIDAENYVNALKKLGGEFNVYPE